jgi:GT2 family glycosyltransferase
MNTVATPTMTPTSVQPSVLISILNWNGAAKTLKCLHSIRDEGALAAVDATVLVIDNGSGAEDVALLQPIVAMPNVVLKSIPTNLGFTGGHNISIELAAREGYDFIWLLNNDVVVQPGTLNELVTVLKGNAQCGAVSPVVRDESARDSVVRCVNTHDWDQRTHDRIVSLEAAQRFQAEQPESVWVDGTAVLFRVAALKDTGVLDDRLFAYYDDNDIGVRLMSKGWFSQCAFNATIFHEVKKTYDEFPLYLFYLLQRNEMLFWSKHAPARHRRMLLLKMIDKGLFDANRMYAKGMPKQGDAILLGAWDFLVGRFGPPRHQAKVPLTMRILRHLSAMIYRGKLKAMRSPQPA